MKTLLITVLTLASSLTASAQSMLENPQFQIFIADQNGYDFDTSNQQGKNKVKNFLLELNEPVRAKALEYINAYYNAVISEDVQTEFKKLNKECNRKDSKVVAILRFDQKCENGYFAFDTRTRAVEQATDGCDTYYSHDLECANSYSFTNEISRNFLKNSAKEILENSNKNTQIRKKLDQILGGSN